jgi:phosphoglucosamine mutase
MVREHGADIGIALDGDADRVLVADETGKLIDGDQLMATVAESWHRDGRLTGGGVVATVMSNLGLEHYVQGLGLDLVRTQVGDRYVVEHMRANGFNVGGEQSGHIVLSEYTTTGDGLIAGLEVLSAMVQTGRPLSEVGRRFDPLPQILENVRFTGTPPLEEASVIKAVQAGEARLGNTGRILMRKSGTEPLIRIMAEGEDADLVQGVVSDIVTAIEHASAGLEI